MMIFLKKHFQFLDGLLPLTPALSLGEREKRSQSNRKSMAAFSRGIHELDEMVRWLFPLPGGESQGEGKHCRITCGCPVLLRPFNHSATS